MTLHLLLTPAGEERSAIDPALPADSLRDEPPPPPLPQPTHLFDLSAEPDSLPRQRWALVLPKGERGLRLRAILDPLWWLRGQQQGAEPDVYFAPANQDEAQASAFKAEYIHSSTKRLREQARYLLLVGTPAELSLELQDSLAEDGVSFVGRLAFERDEDYEAYVAKVLAHERQPPTVREARSLFLSVQDGTPAIQMGQEFLLQPMVNSLREERTLGHFPARELLPEELAAGCGQRLLELAAQPEPGVLFTLSHGLGAPLSGWSRAEQQREWQGNMCLGAGSALTAEDLRHRAFMPGGVWFYFACFGAGSPRGSVYLPWLERLVRENRMRADILDNVLRTRPVDGQPFMAALPQAALANPRGPLAVISHMDLAWTSGFHNSRTGQSHAQRFEGAVASLVRGHRAGVALNSLTRSAWLADSALRRQYQADEEARRSHQEPPTQASDRAALWMERHDLTRYVLLGDPAVRVLDSVTA
ncbi:FAM151 family protein [Archangium violaceum]|uniref:hypothetical protein n=1 Tax=Archangium violaceum TaxID=83451 RepID=UPI0036DB494C